MLVRKVVVLVLIKERSQQADLEGDAWESGEGGLVAAARMADADAAELRRCAYKGGRPLSSGELHISLDRLLVDPAVEQQAMEVHPDVLATRAVGGTIDWGFGALLKSNRVAAEVQMETKIVTPVAGEDYPSLQVDSTAGDTGAGSELELTAGSWALRQRSSTTSSAGRALD